jgi:DNA-binding NarL/FixJ family response regulator
MKILIVDDHALFREGLAELLKGLDPEVQTLQAADANAAMEQTKLNVDIDLVLLDLHMPGPSGLDLLCALKEDLPSVPVVVLSSDETRGSVLRALDKGAVGYIPKSSNSKVMTQALRLVLVGGIYLPAVVVQGDAERHAANPQVSAAPGLPDLGLTPRQMDVLRCLLRGMSTKLMCRELKLQEGTVKSHVQAVFNALNVRTRTQAVLVASQRGVQLGDRHPPPDHSDWTKPLT